MVSTVTLTDTKLIRVLAPLLIAILSLNVEKIIHLAIYVTISSFAWSFQVQAANSKCVSISKLCVNYVTTSDFPIFAEL